jgi:hypothetical protein
VQARSILDFSRGRKGSRNAKAGEQGSFWNPLTALPGAEPSGRSTRAGFDRFNQHSGLLNVKSSE